MVVRNATGFNALGRLLGSTGMNIFPIFFLDHPRLKPLEDELVTNACIRDLPDCRYGTDARIARAMPDFARESIAVLMPS